MSHTLLDFHSKNTFVRMLSVFLLNFVINCDKNCKISCLISVTYRISPNISNVTLTKSIGMLLETYFNNVKTYKVYNSLLIFYFIMMFLM